MDDRGPRPGQGEPIEHGFISGGSQNEIYEIRRGDAARRAAHPAADRARRAATRASCASGASSRRSTAPRCPHTAAIAVCDGPVRARPHLLPDGLRRRLVADGTRPTAWPAPFDTDLDARKGLAYQLVEGIALLGKVDWQAKGLQDLGRPDGFHERQVDRWTAFLERIKGRELPGLRRGRRRGCARTSRSTSSPGSCTATTSSPT